jgi:AcrR family transcriptional regulator
MKMAEDYSKVASHDPDALATESSAKLRLLEAATAEFAQMGFAGARMHSIARAANINKQLIYYYFGNKEQLYNAVLENMSHEISKLTNDAAAKPTEEVALRRALALFKGLGRSPGRDWGRLLMFEALENGGTIHMEAERRRVWARSVDVIVQAQATGKIDAKFDPRLVRLLLLGMPFIPFLLPQMVRVLTDLEPTSDQFSDGWENLIEEIYNRLAPPTNQIQPSKRRNDK